MMNKTNGSATQANGHGPHLSFPPMAATQVDSAQPAFGQDRLMAALALQGVPASVPTPAPRFTPLMPLGRRAPTISDSSVGREIRALRRGQGRTQKELARVVGVTGAQLHRYEAGTTRIAASRLIAIANALGVGADSLIAAGQDQFLGMAPPPMAQTAVQASDDIVELIELFGTITDTRHRSALVAVARMMALPYQRDCASNEG